LTILVLAALVVSAPRGVRAGSALWVDFHHGLLSVDVTQGAWDAVVQEVARRTGIRLHLALPLTGTITAAFTDLPVERALKRLFGPEANFIFLYPNQALPLTAVIPPADVWVLGRDRSEVPGPSRQREPLTGWIAPPESPPESNRDEAREFDRHPELAREMALNAPDVMQRLRAIDYLRQQATPEAMSVLLEVVHDEHPRIRQRALEVLGPLASSDPAIERALVQVFETAVDPQEREFIANFLGLPPEAVSEE